LPVTSGKCGIVFGARIRTKSVSAYRRSPLPGAGIVGVYFDGLDWKLSGPVATTIPV
jgi:hypothetical protein